MNDYFDDFFGADTPRVSKRGGARPNSGPKPKSSRTNPDGSPSAYQRYEAAKADKEEQLARTAKVKADLDEGAVVSREAVRGACAKAFSQIAQSLRGIPDALERKSGIAPEIAEKVALMIDEAMSELSNDLEDLMGGDDV